MITPVQTSEPDLTMAQLLAANADLRVRLEEAEETLRAIRSGEVDALVVEGQAGAQIFTLQGIEAESNQLRGDILAQIGDAVVAVDNGQHVTYLNVTAERQYGIVASDALGRHLQELWTVEWPSPADESAAAAALRETGRWRGENIHVKRSGEKIHVESAVTRLHSASGTPVGTLATIRDITERKQVLEALRARTEETAAVMNALPAFIWTCLDAECRVITGNRTANAVLGVADQTNVSQTAAARGDGIYLRQLKEDGTEYRPEELPMQRAIVTGQPVFDAQLDFRFPDGRRVLAAGNAVPLLDERGRPRGAVAAFLDVTERRRMEEAIQQNEALFSTLIRQSPGAVFALDRELRFRQLNPKAAAVFGHSGELVGRRFGEIMETMWSPEVAAEIMRIFGHTLATGERYVSPDFYQRRADSGADESYEWEIQRLRFPDGEFGVVGYLNDVTADRAMAEALRRSKERFDIVKDGAQVGFWFCDLPFGHLIWDDLVKAHFWLPPEADITIDTFYGRLHPEDRVRTRAAIEDSIANHTRYDIEYRTVPADGPGEKWIRAIGRTFYDAQGSPIRFDGVTLDITARRRAELDARFLGEVSQDLVGLSTVGEVLQTVGAKLGAHLRLSLVHFADVSETDEVVVTHTWHRPELPRPPDTYRLADFLTGECQATLRAGEPFIVGDSTTDPRTNAGRFAESGMAASVCSPTVRNGRWRFLVAIHHTRPHDWTREEVELTREVTERLWTRLERVRFEAALHESEARKKAILASALDAIITMDHEGRLVEFNPAAERIFGHPRAAVLGRPLAEVIVPERLRAKHTEGLQHYLVAGVGPVLNQQIELPALRADGTEFPAELAIIAIPGIQPPLFTAFLRDVTERKQLDDSLRARAAELARADRSKDEFLAMLAHELRNPLAPLHNAAELLMTPDATPEERTQAQDILRRQIGNMTRIIDDLLDVARITEGKIELLRKPVALAPILTAATELARCSLSRANQELTVSLPSEPVFLNADSTRLEQVLVNLLGNACKYSGEGSHICLHAERADGGGRPTVVIRVRDDGIGITPELLPHVFDLFVQGSRTLDRAHGGLGIGLALVQRLVKLHGGSIEARSDGLGQGAEFILSLPILEEIPPPPAPPPAAVREAAHRILIVEDHSLSAQSIAMLLRHRGHETRVALTGPDALAMAVEFTPEVVLLDIGLPGMDGFEVARRLRATPQVADAFLVGLSGYTSDVDHAHAKAAGFDKFMGKPANFDRLREWLCNRDRSRPARLTDSVG